MSQFIYLYTIWQISAMSIQKKISCIESHSEFLIFIRAFILLFNIMDPSAYIQSTWRVRIIFIPNTTCVMLVDFDLTNTRSTALKYLLEDCVFALQRKIVRNGYFEQCSSKYYAFWWHLLLFGIIDICFVANA